MSSNLTYETALKYVRRIHNSAKRGYAYDVYNWLVSNQKIPEPNRPAGLSLMAAQAVRMQLTELMTNHP